MTQGHAELLQQIQELMGYAPECARRLFADNPAMRMSMDPVEASITFNQIHQVWDEKYPMDRGNSHKLLSEGVLHPKWADGSPIT